MARIPRRPFAIVRVRAAFGVGFAILGALIAVKIALAPGPWNTKLIGFAFTVVLVALGAVRVREYVLARRAKAAGP